MASPEIHAEALKIKLVIDSTDSRKSRSRLDLMTWVGTAWGGSALKDLYRDMGDARDAVVFVVRTILESERRRLSNENEAALRARITEDIKILAAITEMTRADNSAAAAAARNL